MLNKEIKLYIYLQAKKLGCAEPAKDSKTFSDEFVSKSSVYNKEITWHWSPTRLPTDGTVL